MGDDIKIQCKNCLYWKNRHCENFSSKWFGMVTGDYQNCGQFNPIKKTNKNQADGSKSASKETTSEASK